MTEHWAELPVLCSRFLYRAAYTSIPNRTQLVSGAVASTVSSPFFPFPFMMSLCRHARVAFLTAILWYFSMHRSIYMWKGKIAHLYFVVFINDMNFRGTRVTKNECYSHAITVSINRKAARWRDALSFPYAFRTILVLIILMGWEKLTHSSLHLLLVVNSRPCYSGRLPAWIQKKKRLGEPVITSKQGGSWFGWHF